MVQCLAYRPVASSIGVMGNGIKGKPPTPYPPHGKFCHLGHLGSDTPLI